MGYSKVVRIKTLEDGLCVLKKKMSQKTFVTKYKTFKRNGILGKPCIVLFFEILYELCASIHRVLICSILDF